MVLLFIIAIVIIVAIIIFIVKSNQSTDVPPTQEEIDALAREAEEVLLQHTINRARIICREAKANGEMAVLAIIASADYETWKASGASEELHNTAVWLRDKYICRNLDNGKPYFLFEHFDIEDIDKCFDAYANPANRAQLDDMHKQAYDSFNVGD